MGGLKRKVLRIPPIKGVIGLLKDPHKNKEENVKFRTPNNVESPRIQHYLLWNQRRLARVAFCLMNAVSIKGINHWVGCGGKPNKLILIQSQFVALNPLIRAYNTSLVRPASICTSK